MSSKKVYRRPFASTGMTPKGHRPFKLSDTHGHSILRRLRPHAESLNNRRVLTQVEKAVDRYKISFHPSRRASSLPPAKKQRENAARIAALARGLLKAMSAADTETIKRLAQLLAFGGDAEERAKWREELTGLLPGTLILLAQAADYGVRRADRHGGGGRRGPPLQALVVDLARIWKEETGRPFQGSREETNHSGLSERASARSFVDLVLYDVASVTKQEVSKKRLDWLMTFAHAVVTPGTGDMSTESGASSDDRYWDHAEE